MTIEPDRPPLSEFDAGLLVGLLVGEGSFGGDGKQPQVTLRMHTRHEALFMWLVERLPRAKLYGPYTHGGRSYFQWMARGRVLVEDLLPLLEERVTPELDAHAAERLAAMVSRYSGFIARERARSTTDAASGAHRPEVAEPQPPSIAPVLGSKEPWEDDA